MENFQQLSTEASTSNRDSEKAMVISPIAMFSALAGEAQDPNDTDSQHSDNCRDYWDSFIEVQTQKLNKLEKRSSRSRDSG